MKKTQRMTKQKRVILDVLRSGQYASYAEWIYQEARKEIPGLSLGTVYRNLNLLRDNGEIQGAELWQQPKSLWTAVRRITTILCAGMRQSL